MNGPRKHLLWVTTPLLTAALIGLWHVSIGLFDISRFILPRPADVAGGLAKMLSQGETYGHAMTTITEALAGFLLGSALGILTGAVLGKLPLLEFTLRPFIIALQVVPKIALIPLFILWFGFGPESKILMSAMLAFFPVFANTLFGIKSVDPGHRDVMISLNASRWTTFTRLELPSSLPAIMTGMEVGMVFATVGAVVGEFMGGSQGLGFVAVSSLNAGEVDILFADLILLTVVGFALYSMVLAFRRIAVPWHESVIINRQNVA
jgi:NitT/TauT family transport system permease protein